MILYSTMFVCVYNDALKLVQDRRTDKVLSVGVSCLSISYAEFLEVLLFMLSVSIKPPLSAEELSSDTQFAAVNYWL